VNRRLLWRIVALAALVAAVVMAYLMRDRFAVAALQGWIDGAGALGPAVYMAVYALATVLFLPGSVITLAGGALFGPLWGTLYSLTGATIGATAAFFIARYLAAGWVSRKASGLIKQVIDGVEAEGWHFVAFVRLMPLFPFNLLNYVLGLTRISPMQYVIASYVFMFPGAFAYTYLGYAGREALGGGEDVLGKGLLAMALIAVVAFLPRLIRRVREARRLGQLSAAELRLRLARREDITVLDVRSAKDYAGELGHIDRSLNIPLDQLPGRLPELDHVRERPIAVICRTNRMSSRAVELLRRADFRRVQLVADGMLAWRRQDHA
jgi:uncharacterized membrane protein YdjX (TVP38/TMEM64 family)/rhodanese-related sulfurtransferase